MTDDGRERRGGRREEDLPAFSRRLFGWFMWYVRKYLARNFHAVRLLRPEAGGGDVPSIAGEPV
ncbi:MAG: hypothetical protein ACKORK_04975, partial [Gemmatimonadota bacterium]